MENGGTNPAATKEVKRTIRPGTVVAGVRARRRHHHSTFLPLRHQQLPDLVRRLLVPQTRLRQDAVRSLVPASSSNPRHLGRDGRCFWWWREREGRMLRSPENFLRASEHKEGKSTSARERKKGNGPIHSPFYISKFKNCRPRRFARRSVASIDATVRRISRRSRDVSGCQAYFPRSARRPRVPPVWLSYPSGVVWTRVHSFSRWDVLEV